MTCADPLEQDITILALSRGGSGERGRDDPVKVGLLDWCQACPGLAAQFPAAPR
jgi:hypothetical protein